MQGQASTFNLFILSFPTSRGRFPTPQRHFPTRLRHRLRGRHLSRGPILSLRAGRKGVEPGLFDEETGGCR
jgi:hypothetical protein